MQPALVQITGSVPTTAGPALGATSATGPQGPQGNPGSGIAAEFFALMPPDNAACSR